MVFVRLKNKFILCVSLLSAATSVLAACDFGDFPVMDEMHVQSLMDDANYNNRPMMVRAFVSDASYQQVVDYYHRLWKEYYDDTAFGIWHQITTMTDECMLTVQVTPQGDSSYGRLLISNPPVVSETEANVGSDLLMPGDAIVVSDLKTDDGPKKGRISMLASADSLDGVVKFYMTEMQNSGWVLERHFSQGGARVLVFRDGLNTRNIVLGQAGDMTQILINDEFFK